MAPPLAAAAAVYSTSPLFSPSSSRPLVRRHAPPSYVSMRARRCSQLAAAAAAAESSSSPLLEVRGLTASVKETGQQILAGVDLTIREGEVRVGLSFRPACGVVLLNWGCEGLIEDGLIRVLACCRFMRSWGRTAPARAPSQR
jgi:hypothetical protein